MALVEKERQGTEVYAIHKALAPAQAAAAAKRMLAGVNPTENFGRVGSDHHTRETSDKVGGFAGCSGRTVEKTVAVDQAAGAEPERFGDLPKMMWRSATLSAFPPSAAIHLRGMSAVRDP